MKNQFLSSVAISAAVVVGLAGFGCKKGGGGDAPSGGFATVNGDTISATDFYEYLERKPTVQVNTPNGPQEVQVAGTLAFQALKDLVQQKLLLTMAKDDGVYPSDDDVDKELKFRQSRTPDFVKLLQNQGLTLEEIRDQLRLQLARERIITKGIIITPTQAKSYIASHKSTFSTPAQAQLLWIVVPDSKKKTQVDDDLASGQSFSQVAMKYSVAPEARQTGGRFPQTNLAQLPAWLQKLVAATSELKGTPWKQDSTNWIKFYVQSKIPAKPVAVDSSLLELVQRQLAEQKGDQTTDLNKRMSDKIKVAKVQVDTPFLQNDWNTATQNLNSPPASAPKQ